MLESGDRRRAVILAGAMLAMGIAVVHWSGLVLAGAIVGLGARSLTSAMLGGLAVGIVAWLGFLAWLWYVGTVGPFLASGILALVSLGIALALPLLGSLARGLVSRAW